MTNNPSERELRDGCGGKGVATSGRARDRDQRRHTMELGEPERSAQGSSSCASSGAADTRRRSSAALGTRTPNTPDPAEFARAGLGPSERAGDRRRVAARARERDGQDRPGGRPRSAGPARRAARSASSPGHGWRDHERTSPPPGTGAPRPCGVASWLPPPTMRLAARSGPCFTVSRVLEAAVAERSLLEHLDDRVDGLAVGVGNAVLEVRPPSPVQVRVAPPDHPCLTAGSFTFGVSARSSALGRHLAMDDLEDPGDRRALSSSSRWRWWCLMRSVECRSPWARRALRSRRRRRSVAGSVARKR